jgi:hypothetical protein
MAWLLTSVRAQRGRADGADSRPLSDIDPRPVINAVGDDERCDDEVADRDGLDTIPDGFDDTMNSCPIRLPSPCEDRPR